MTLTLEQFNILFPFANPKQNWVDSINKYAPSAGLTGVRLAQFLAQCGHETGGFNKFVEGFNYSAQGLLATFGKYFTKQTAQEYARQPEKIANYVYANRMGNGSVESGDGWKYIGRGLIMVTGRANYTTCSKEIFNDDRLVKNPEKLVESDNAIRSALWFWDDHNINALADKENTAAVTKVINGGTNGLEDRISRYTLAKTVLGLK